MELDGDSRDHTLSTVTQPLPNILFILFHQRLVF